MTAERSATDPSRLLADGTGVDIRRAVAVSQHDLEDLEGFATADAITERTSRRPR